jgi:hypothetical protein
MRVSHDIPVRMLVILPHRLLTMEGIVMDPLPKILFGFELDHAHAWSQVSLSSPCTSSTVVTILDVVVFLR